MRKYRSSILLAILMTALCGAIILGSTLAYFTSEEQTGENIIAASNLEVGFDWASALPADESGWQNAADNTLFNEAHWEPNHAAMRYIRIRNGGDLAFQYELNVLPTMVVEGGPELMDVIDVYFGIVDDTTPAITRANFAAQLTRVGTMRDLLSNENGAAFGILLPEGASADGINAREGSVTACMVLHMQQEAGNEYMGLSAGEGFKLQLAATQYNYLPDAFGQVQNPTLPDVGGYGTEVIQPVQPSAGGVLAADVNFASSTGVTATVPAGAQLEAGAAQLKLIVTPKAQSEANVTLAENEVLDAWEVTVEGLSKENTTPVRIAMGKVLPKALNIGNYKLYHVENGTANLMTLVPEVDAASAHNSYSYDPATGEVVVAMATFSEVTIVTEPAKWEGNFDYSWYTDAVMAADGEATAEYIIANADQLAAFGAIVGGMDGQTADTFKGKTVKLIADIDLGDAEDNNNSELIFYPIGYTNNLGTYKKTAGALKDNDGNAFASTVSSFEGIFDGNGHTISNFYQNTWEMFGDYNNGYSGTPNHYKDGMGLFGYVVNGTVKNLTVDNFSSDGEFTPTGVIAAYAVNSTFENIAITNCNPRVYNTGNGGIVGIGGNSDDSGTYKLNFTNITIDNTNKISALWGSWDVACGGLVGMFRGAGHVYMTNCHVAAQMDVYNDVCGNYQYYWYRYSGMMVGTNKNMTTDADGYTVPETDKFHAEGCTVHFGEWNDYYYCELVANSLASYTHDHQFSRLTEIESLDEIKSGDTWLKAGNFLLIDGDSKTCYHIVDKDGELMQHRHIDAGEETVNGATVYKEDKTVVYLPFNQLFTGYGWGVKHIPVHNGKDYAFSGIRILDRVDTNSISKFTAKDNVQSITTGSVHTIGEFFEAIDQSEYPINVSNVYVSVSPVSTDDNVSTATARYEANQTNWEEGTLTFEGTGNAVIIIQDYYFCKPTTLEVFVNDYSSIDKFIPVENLSVVAGKTITLGEIFHAIEGVTINSTSIVLSIDGAEYTYTQDINDWTKSAIVFNSLSNAVTITINDTDYCNDANNTFAVIERDVFTTVFENTDKYLYRVGNKNTVELSSLFKLIDGETINNPVTVAIETDKGNSTGELTNTITAENWGQGTVQFSGTGVVKVTIDALGAEAYSLYLEVVDAYNVTAYSELKEQNSVLLNDIIMSSGGTYRLTGNKTLYGNGFKLDVKNGAHTSVEYDYQSYVVYLENSRLDNVVITGAVYPEIGGTRSENYNRAIVMTSGECLIANSYISNGASPIRNGGNLQLINTTLKGGAYANLDMRNGHLILDNVTTINQIGANDKYIDANGSEKEIIGLGIVVYQEGGSEDLKITIKNDLTQYNYLSKTQADKYIDSDYGKIIVSQIYTNNTYAGYLNGEWANTGIISMNDYFSASDLIDESTNGNVRFGSSGTVTLLGKTRECYVYSFKPKTTSAPAYPGYTTIGQYHIEPDVVFDFSEKNYVPKVENSNDYCYENKGTIYISMDEGDSFSWDTDILSVTKNGNNIPTSSTPSDELLFDTNTETKVIYQYTDTHNYRISSTGEVEEYSIVYEKTLLINVVVVEAAAKHAEFSFGANGTAYTSKAVLIGNKTYVMPDVTATVDGKIGSTTVNGTTVYYPITEMYTNDGKTTHAGNWFACFPIFEDAVQIVDYENAGTGDPVIYNQTTVTTVDKIPSTLKATNPTAAFLYSMNATNYPPPTEPTAVNNAVCYTCNRNGLDSGNTRNEMTIFAEYTYRDNVGTDYYYYVGYHCPEQTKDTSSGCVTPDTLVTLSDGTKKEIRHITYEDQLLVWDFYKGEYASVTPALIVNHGHDLYNVIELQFEEGTTVKAINAHAFFDADQNQFVLIDSNNVSSFVGHNFIKHAGETASKVKLVAYEVYEEETESYTLVSSEHYNFITEDMFSLTNAFHQMQAGLVVGENLKYDVNVLTADENKFGLYTYNKYSDYITEEQFIAFGGPYLKISVEKGYTTYEYTLSLIEEYLK